MADIPRTNNLTPPIHDGTDQPYFPVTPPLEQLIPPRPRAPLVPVYDTKYILLKKMDGADIPVLESSVEVIGCFDTYDDAEEYKLRYESVPGAVTYTIVSAPYHRKSGRPPTPIPIIDILGDPSPSPIRSHGFIPPLADSKTEEGAFNKLHDKMMSMNGLSGNDNRYDL